MSFANLSGKTAVVTGSSSGIGKAIAIELAAAGANVVVHYCSSKDTADETARQVREAGQQAEVLQADLGGLDETRCAEVVETFWQVFGSVDIWINNAGADLLTGPAADLGYADKLAELLNVDVKSTVLLGSEVGRRMTEQGSGVILNVGWDQADRGMEGSSGELFAVSKNAIMGFTRSLAVSLAPAVRVNCIAPGWILTAWGEGASEYWQERVRKETPLERWGLPEDIAKMARFLVSDDASFVTGQVINVNGGAVR
jgi:3-oxoacyl-[acyl-carrier protein] reductase